MSRRTTAKPVDFRQLTLLLTPSELGRCDALAVHLGCDRQEVLTAGLRLLEGMCLLPEDGEDAPSAAVVACPLHGTARTGRLRNN